MPILNKADVKVLPIFRYIQKTGDISEHDMFNTFNMGVGMCMTVSKETADAAIKALKANGIDAYQIGLITKGPEKVELC